MRKPSNADCLLDTPEPSASRPRQDAEALVDGAEEGEEMDVANNDDAAMMAMMGMGGFGSTKVRTPSYVFFSPPPWCRCLTWLLPGQACRRQSGWQRGYQEAANMAAVHEPVCIPLLVSVWDDHFAQRRSTLPVS